MCVLFKRKYCPKLIMSLNTKSSSCQYIPKNVLGSDFQFVSVQRKSAITKLLAKEGEMELQSIVRRTCKRKEKFFFWSLFYYIKLSHLINMLKQKSSQVMTSYGKFWCQCCLSETVIPCSPSRFNYSLISSFKAMVDRKITTKTRRGKSRLTVVRT